MPKLPTEIVRTICSFTNTCRFLNGCWIDISLLVLLQTPKKHVTGLYYLVKLDINVDKQYILEYIDGFYQYDNSRYFRCYLASRPSNHHQKGEIGWNLMTHTILFDYIFLQD
jgi:hypothetical protein